MMSLANEIIYGNANRIASILQHGIDVNQIDEYGYTPLIEATIKDDVEMAKLLIAAGADVNKADLTGGSALHWAVENYNMDMCRLLLSHKANANAFSAAGQPVLVKPVLRDQQDLKLLLYQNNASLTFAQDFINAKLLGHRFELVGQADIANHEGKFVEVDFEGFFLEFSIELILHSLIQFINNYAARELRSKFLLVQKVINALYVSAELIKYQQYLINIDQYRDKINTLLQHDLLIIPANYEGHAVTFVKYGQLLAKCDRRNGDHLADSVTIYKMQHPRKLNKQMLRKIIYEKKTAAFVESQLPKILGLQLLSRVMLDGQISGNCSWANVEAVIPAAILLLSHNLQANPLPLVTPGHDSIEIYNQWHEWDKDRALHFCIENFYGSNPARKASKAAILANIFFQRCGSANSKDLDRMRKIAPVLKIPGYEYILNSYIEIYSHHAKTKAGENLKRMLELYEMGL